MDVFEVFKFFGGTIFLEEFRGDLNAISMKLDAYLGASTLLDPRDREASSSILRSIWYALRGDFHRSRETLSKLDYTTTRPRWRYRILTYKALVELWALHPPTFRIYPLRSSVGLTNWFSDRPHAQIQEARLECPKYEDYARPEDLVEHEMIMTLVILMFERDVVHGETLESKALYSRLETLRDRCSESALEQGAAYVARLLHEACRTWGFDEKALGHLDDMQARYARIGDTHGLGLCELLRGELCVSPRRSSLILLNLDIVDQYDGFGYGSSTAGLIELARDSTLSSTSEYGKVHPQDIEEAIQRFHSAERHFQEARSRRAIAAVQLNLACLQHVQTIDPAGLWANPSYDRLISTLNSFLESMAQFEAEGDLQNSRLAGFHWSLNLNTNRSHDISTSIFNQSHDEGNEAFALCLGLFACKVGHYFRYHCGDVIRAKFAFQSGERALGSLSQRSIREEFISMPLSIQTFVGLVGCCSAIGDDRYINYRMPLFLAEVQTMFELFVKGNRTIDKIHSIDTLREQAFFLVRIIESWVFQSATSTDLSWSSPEISFFVRQLNLIGEILNCGNVTQAWTESQEVRFNYLKTIHTHKIRLNNNLATAAHSTISQFLAILNEKYEDSMWINIYRIDLACRIGNFMYGQSILDTMADGDDTCGPDLNDITYPLHPLLPIMSQRLRILESTENLFEAAINAQEWQRAKKLLIRLEEQSPGYFTSVSSYTSKWPWRRCLYAGLVFEQEKQYHLSLCYLFQSWMFIKAWRSCSTGKLFDNVDGISRVTNSIIRILLRTKDVDSQIRPPYPCDSFFDKVDSHIMYEFKVGRQGRPEAGFCTLYAIYVLEVTRSQTMDQLSGQIWGSKISSDRDASHQYETWSELGGRLGQLDDEEFKAWRALTSERTDAGLPFESGARTLVEDAVRVGGIGSMWGFERVMKAIRSIPTDALIVYLGLSREGLAIVALTNHGVKHASYNAQATSPLVAFLVASFLQCIVSSNGLSTHLAFHPLLKLLSALILQPLTGSIEKRTHVIFVPSGALSRLPFGILLHKNDYLIMKKSISQIPSLCSLADLSARQRTTFNPGKDLAVIAKPGSPRNAREPCGEKVLPMAAFEAVLIAGLHGVKALHGAQISQDDMRGLMKNSKILHIVTHGHFDASKPSSSYISLKERFRVMHLVAGIGDLKMVVFSACLSGMGVANDSGDITGFSHAILSAGAELYLGALWSHYDITTAIHMYLFYRRIGEVSGQGEADTLGECWRRATIELYGMKPDEALGLLTQWISDWDVLNEVLYNEEFMRHGKRKLQRIIEDLGTVEGRKMLNFRHPFHWAPFIMVGNSSLMISDTYTKQTVGKADEPAPHIRSTDEHSQATRLSTQNPTLVDGKPRCATQ